MKISVAMATYNGEKYILEQLDSLLNQTLDIDEVIICDDYSKDNTCQIIEKYIKKNRLEKRWILYKNNKNKGYANNFYTCMYKTSGDYVFFCDQDDIWNNDKVEIMVNEMKRNKKIKMLASDFDPYYYSEDAPKISSNILKKMKDNSTLEHIKLNRKTIFIGSEGCTMCITREFLDKIEKYWFDGWAHDEYVWKLSLCMDGCYIIHKKTIKRRLHSNNVSKRKIHRMEERVIFLEKLLKSHEAMLKFAEENNLSMNEIRLIKNNINSVRARLSLLKEGKFKNIINSLKYINYFYSKKSILVETYLAINEKVMEKRNE